MTMTHTATKPTDADLLDRIAADADEPVGPALDAAPLRALSLAVHQRDAAETAIRDAVTAARAEGLSWAVIGTVLGISRQGALQRYGTHA